MRKFSTTYSVICPLDGSERMFGSWIYAEDFLDAESKAFIRGLGEKVDFEYNLKIQDDGTLDYDKELTVSFMFENNYDPMKIIHGVIWLANIQKNTECLMDFGVLHELAHYYSFPNEPLNKSKEILLGWIKDFEKNTCGYLPY